MKYLCSIGLGDKDETVLKSLVSLLEGKTGEPWTYRDDEHVDVALIDVDSPAGTEAWMRLNAAATTRCVAYTRSASHPGARWVLPKPLRAAALIDLLNHIDVDAAVEAPAAVPATPAARELELVDLLNRDLDTPMQVSDGEHRLIVDKPSGRFSASHELDQMHALCEVPVSRLHLERVDAGEDPKGSWQPLIQLLWYCALVGSHGHLLNGLDPRARYRLRRWPNFKQLKHSPEDYRLSAFMTRHAAATVEDIAAATGVARDHVIAFLNAAASCGFLRMETAPRAPAQPTMPSAPPVRHGLLAMIRTRLGLGQQHHAGA